MAKSPKKPEASRKKVSSNLNSRMLIEEQTAAFLKSGGKILQIPTGTSGVTSGSGQSQAEKKSPKATS
ncbi:MAG: hypothetical protein O6945_03605 [Gammaproteobacteria bacterium]|nr:hypothetical protein [Gammaproteobacteria bacterium]